MFKRSITLAGREYEVTDRDQIINKFGKVIKPILNKDGYYQYSFTINGKRLTTYEHRVIWMLHNGAIPEGMVVDHINEIKTDNRIENLQLMKPGENVAKSKAKTYQILSPQGALFTITNLNEFCRRFKLDCGNMVGVSKGRHSHHKGWKINELQRD